jgi:hypothetical protein
MVLAIDVNQEQEFPYERNQDIREYEITTGAWNGKAEIPPRPVDSGLQGQRLSSLMQSCGSLLRFNMFWSIF